MLHILSLLLLLLSRFGHVRLCGPHGQQPRRLLCPQDSPGKNTGVGYSVTAAAAAAKSLQSCPTVCDPIDGSPPGSPGPGILQARTLEWVSICILLRISEPS